MSDTGNAAPHRESGAARRDWSGWRGKVKGWVPALRQWLQAHRSNWKQWLPRRGGGWKQWLPWLRWGTVALLSTLLLLDIAFPLPLPRARDHGALVVARDGRPLRAFADREGVWRHAVVIEDVSPLYMQALLTYEDRWFWQHPGVNPVALARAGWQMVKQRQIVSGGSTLTMQVARILDPHTRTPWGKLKQILRALQLEAHLSKREILRLYLERAPYGGTIEGVDAASWAYLGKSSARLSHAEAALLAVLPQQPSRLRPDRHPDPAQRARDKVLARMASLGAWPRSVVEDARIEQVVARSLQQPLHAALLAERLRQRQPRATRIHTTIDADLQEQLEDRVTSYFSRLPPRTSAALLVVDNNTMEALAYVGSVEFGDPKRLGHVDMVRAVRSPGSTLKPFLYGIAMDDGLVHSESLLIDAPQSFGGYRPGNFGEDYHGPVSVAEALNLSLNVPAVEVLDHVGPARFSARLANAGMAMQLPRGEPAGLPLILGGVGVRLEEIVGAYTALQRNGVAGKVRYTPDDKQQDRRLLSPGAAWIVREILRSNPRPGAFSGSTSSNAVAWKTGTSYGFRDAWAIGSVPRYTVGVWVGRPDATPLPGQYGAVTALPLLFDVIDTLPNARRDIASERPPSVGEAEICWPAGGIAPVGHEVGSTQCQRRRHAWTLDGALPPTFPERDARAWNSLVERIDVDAKTGQRISANCTLPHTTHAREITRWPALAMPWLSETERRQSQLPALAADCADDHRTIASALRIEGIAQGGRLAKPPNRDSVPHLDVRALGSEGRVRWLLDSRWAGETVAGKALSLPLDMPVGAHTLTALTEEGGWDSVRFEVVELRVGR